METSTVKGVLGQNDLAQSPKLSAAKMSFQLQEKGDQEGAPQNGVQSKYVVINS